MMKTDLYNLKGEIMGKVDLPKNFFGLKAKPALIAQAVRVFLSNRRRAGAKTKGRGEVAGSTRKIYRQKGTGRARHGAKRAPIFVGGGIAHGPTGKQNYQKHLTKNQRRLAIAGVLNQKLTAKEILVVGGWSKLKPKTKVLNQALIVLKIYLAKEKVALIVDKKTANLAQASQNLKNFSLLTIKQLNVFNVLKNKRLIITPEALALWSTKKEQHDQS